MLSLKKGVINGFKFVFQEPCSIKKIYIFYIASLIGKKKQLTLVVSGTDETIKYNPGSPVWLNIHDFKGSSDAKTQQLIILLNSVLQLWKVITTTIISSSILTICDVHSKIMQLMLQSSNWECVPWMALCCVVEKKYLQKLWLMPMFLLWIICC